ncbi:hypothetical protein D3C87_1195780 [compost metagenome]
MFRSFGVRGCNFLCDALLIGAQAIDQLTQCGSDKRLHGIYGILGGDAAGMFRAVIDRNA